MKILVAGDFAPRNRISSLLETGDFSFLEEVRPVIQSSDYSIVNFESPVVTREALSITKTGPRLKCTAKAMECLKQVGFNCVTLANNHFRDYGQTGVEDTIEACKKYGVDYVGGGVNYDEALSILYKKINGETLAVINVCENEWSVATRKRGGAYGMDIIGVCHQLKTAHLNADFVLLIIHGGIELYPLPTPRMKKLYRFFAEMGADAIVNHHQHCYSGYETYMGVPIFYGIGNLCFDKAVRDDLENSGYMVSIETKDKSFDIHPYQQATNDYAGVCLTKDNKAVFQNIERLNEHIKDDDKLESEYIKAISTTKPLWKSLLNPYQSKFLNRLVRLGLLPSFVDDSRRNRLYNIVSCESHREKLLTLLNIELKHE